VLTILLAAAESSKTPFYIAGAALALWAVVLAGIGLTRPEFPYGASGERGVIGISFVMILIAIATAILT
jgi:hypothetical protein